MSLAGFKKQVNKANQFMSEKIGGAKGTVLDEEFTEMERKIDVMSKLTDDIITKTQEFLQPNPATRVKMASVSAFQKMRGQAKSSLYPQPEGTLGEFMIKHGQDMGESSMFETEKTQINQLLQELSDQGLSLIDSGESFKQLAEVKYSLEENVKQNFLEPLTLLKDKDLKEVTHHRKKLSGRRLDFDCKKRKKDKGSHITDDELVMAEEKFEESKQITENAMHNLLENDVEQIAQLQSFVEAQIDYHRQATDLLQDLAQNLESRRNEASNRPKSDHLPKRVSSFNISKRSPSPFEDSYNMNSGGHYESDSHSSRSQACCEALYDFEPENEGELGFNEGDIINLTTQIDENWFEGEVRGQHGFFPINYVKVLTPLP